MASNIPAKRYYMTVCCERELYSRARELARLEGISMPRLLRRLLLDYIVSHESCESEIDHETCDIDACASAT